MAFGDPTDGLRPCVYSLSAACEISCRGSRGVSRLLLRARRAVRRSASDACSSLVSRRVFTAPMRRATVHRRSRGATAVPNAASLRLRQSRPSRLARDDGLQLIDCRITNSVKCVPPENKPLPVEIRTCNRYLRRSCRTPTDAGAAGAWLRLRTTPRYERSALKPCGVQIRHGAEYQSADGPDLARFVSLQPLQHPDAPADRERCSRGRVSSGPQANRGQVPADAPCGTRLLTSFTQHDRRRSIPSPFSRTSASAPACTA